MNRIELWAGTYIVWGIGAAIVVVAIPAILVLAVWCAAHCAEYVWDKNGTRRKVKAMLMAWPVWKYDVAEVVRRQGEPGVSGLDPSRLKLARELFAEMDPHNALQWKTDPKDVTP